MDKCKLLSDKRFHKYFDMLIEWNNKFNLTRVVEKQDVFVKHFYDSILPLDLISAGSNLLDVGSGAGFPGIPLKIVEPSLKIILIDSVRKKVDFLNAVIQDLQLEGIIALHSRIEDYCKRDFDIATSRAVAPLNVLAEYCLPFVKVGGSMVAYKAKEVEKELAEAKGAIRELGGEIESIHTRKLDEQTDRVFILIRKIKRSAAEYPRRNNKPRMKPL